MRTISILYSPNMNALMQQRPNLTEAAGSREAIGKKEREGLGGITEKMF